MRGQLRLLQAVGFGSVEGEDGHQVEQSGPGDDDIYKGACILKLVRIILWLKMLKYRYCCEGAMEALLLGKTRNLEHQLTTTRLRLAEASGQKFCIYSTTLLCLYNTSQQFQCLPQLNCMSAGISRIIQQGIKVCLSNLETDRAECLSHWPAGEAEQCSSRIAELEGHLQERDTLVARLEEDLLTSRSAPQENRNGQNGSKEALEPAPENGMSLLYMAP